MSLVFATHTQLLRTHFPAIRLRLQGYEGFLPVVDTHQVKNSRVTTIVRTVSTVILSGILISAIILMASLVLPEAFERFKTTTVERNFIASALQKQPAEVRVEQTVVDATPLPTPTPILLPPKDENLPKEAWIYIPTIGVDSQLHITENPDEALEKGVWLVPDFGRPEQNEDPIIVAAHRFGWDTWWQSDFGTKHSFYWLTETKPGDRVEIVSDQRKWVYEIYEVGEGEEITDYSADLILYTCKFLNSPQRYFRYARRVVEA